MPELEPITREETLLDGGDLTPITRKEMFIKRIYDKNQSVPEPITREEHFLKKAGEGSGGDVTIEQLNVTQNGTYSESGKAYSPVVVNVPAPPVPENAYLLNNLSGLPADIASFSDGTDLPMASLKVAVTPYQDLHGYDAPWAGGAGKNKFDIEGWLNSSRATYTKSGNTYTISATDTLYGTPFTFSDTDVAVSVSASSYVAGTATHIRMQLLDSNNNVVGELTPNQSYQKREGLVASKVRFNWTVPGTFTITEPQIELGSTVTTFAPYSNICPISGWDEVNVGVSGKNLLQNNPWYNFAYNASVGDTLDTSTSVPSWTTSDNETYTTTLTDWQRSGWLSAKLPQGTTVTSSVLFVSGNPRVTSYILDENFKITRSFGLANPISDNTQYGHTITLTNNECYFAIAIIGSNKTTVINKPIIEIGSTATAYEPYNGQTYTIDLDGTRYGGVVDATNGTMDDTLDHIASYNGEALPSTWISDRDVYAEGTTPTIGAEVVYTRATPITVQLAPTPVKSIEGENNISANCGQITEGKYFKRA